MQAGQSVEMGLPDITPLFGGTRRWFDITEQRMVDTATLYIPYGCKWGGLWGGPEGTVRNEKRNGRCRFCALPQISAKYRKEVLGGNSVDPATYIELFRRTLESLLASGVRPHTLFVFNAGSWFEMEREIQLGIARLLREARVARVIVESKASCVTPEALESVLEELQTALSVRFGVETQDPAMRKLLVKGDTEDELERAAVESPESYRARTSSKSRSRASLVNGE
jgi:uncharacterized Fe-S cluster-containing MiaB family protein